MIDSRIVAKIRPSTCAIVHLPRPHEELYPPDTAAGTNISIPQSETIATGFLIRRDLALTNRHVVLEIAKRSKKEGGLRHWYLLFTYPRPEGGLSQTYKRISNAFAFMEPSGGSRLDAGILSFNPGGDLDENLCGSVEFGELSTIRVGVEIAICGFPLGNALTLRAPGVTRFGPVVHQGIISGLAPFDVLDPREIITFLTDLNTAGGMSGSPVFFPQDGKVVGLHFAGAQGTLGCASPVDRLRADQWVELYEKVIVRKEPVGAIRVTGGGDIAPS